MIKRIRNLCVAMVCVMILSGCAGFGGDTEKSTQKETAELFAMNTIMSLTVYDENAKEVLSEARGLIQKCETLFSVNIEGSDVARLNVAKGEPVQVADETYELLKKSMEMSEKTDGLFDVSIYPLVRAWGFTTETYRVPDKKEIKDLLKQVDYHKIKLSENNMVEIPKEMQIDLGAIAKGYLSQKLTELFAKSNVTAAVVSLGGNVQTYGVKPDGTPFQVGIIDPEDGVSAYGRIQVEEKAIVTSGAYQRFFEKDGKTYHHIMDKRTGAPAESDLKSVTVIADQGDVADSLATALFVMGKEKAIAFSESRKDIQLILIDSENEVWTSEGVQFERMNEL